MPHDPLTPEQRALRSRIGAHKSWSRTTDPAARTAPARAGLLAKFEREVDPDGTLPPTERAHRARPPRRARAKGVLRESGVQVGQIPSEGSYRQAARSRARRGGRSRRRRARRVGWWCGMRCKERSALSAAVVTVTIPPDLSPTPEELRAEAYRLVDLVVTAVRQRHRKVPGVGTPAWWRAPDEAKVAALLVLSEAWLIHDPDRAAVERLKAMSVDLSAAHDWTAASRRPSNAELTRRRGEPGPLARTVDPAAAARWAATGTSAEGAA